MPGIPKSCAACKNDLEEHENWHSVIHPRCRFCKIVVHKLENASSFEHCTENEARVKSEDARTCSKCFKVFTKACNRKRHEDDKKCEKEATPTLEKKPKIFTCAFCEVSFSDECSLIRHKKIHEENFNCLKCDQCNKKFIREDNRAERHVKLVHNLVAKNKIQNFLLVQHCANSPVINVENLSN